MLPALPTSGTTAQEELLRRIWGETMTDDRAGATRNADDEMLERYKIAVERALPRVPVKNGVVEIDSVWVETSLPYDLLEAILRREDLVRPANVERIVLRTRAQPQQPQGEQSGSGKRRRKREVRN